MTRGCCMTRHVVHQQYVSPSGVHLLRSRQRRAEEEETAKREETGSITLVERRKKEAMQANRAISKVDKMPDELRQFMVQIRDGGTNATADELLSVMRGFKDNVTLDHLYRDQLVSIARFLAMNAFAPTAILRFQIRSRLKKLRNEDKEIMWEGLNTLRCVISRELALP